MKLDDLYTGETWAVLQSDGTIPVVTDLLNNMVRIGANSTESSSKRVVYGTAQAIFAEVERGRATGSHVTRNHVAGRHASRGQSHVRKSYAISGLVGPRKSR